MLQAKNLTFSVEDENTPAGKEKRTIIDKVSFEIADGEMLVVTGPNGSGKSTLVKLLMGIETPDAGEILLDGKDISKLSIAERAGAGIGYAFQQPPRFKGMTIRKLLSLAAGEPLNEEKCCALLSSVGLCAGEYIDRQADDTLSGGEMKRIEIATVLAHPHKVCLFDEPEAGIDLWSMDGLIKCFNQSKTDNKSINIIVSHQEKILDIADKILVLDNKQIKEFGARNDILGKLKLSPTNCIRLNKEKTND